MVYIVQQTKKEAFTRYVKAFGFGEKTGVELSGEVAGNISSLDKRGDIYGYTASYGQGITATPIQLIAGYAAIANGGKLMKPYIVSEIVKQDGESVKTEPHVVREVMSPRTAALLTGMLTSVVENSYDRKAQVPGYRVAGKTGTAQVASPNGGYSDKTIHTMLGFGPTTDPQFVILIKLNNPQGPRFASDTITPMFSQMASYLLQYYKIAPE
jgi:cell division protein FtsI/penicillin-binding protein 2